MKQLLTAIILLNLSFAATIEDYVNNNPNGEAELKEFAADFTELANTLNDEVPKINENWANTNSLLDAFNGHLNKFNQNMDRTNENWEKSNDIFDRYEDDVETLNDNWERTLDFAEDTKEQIEGIGKYNLLGNSALFAAAAAGGAALGATLINGVLDASYKGIIGLGKLISEAITHKKRNAYYSEMFQKAVEVQNTLDQSIQDSYQALNLAIGAKKLKSKWSLPGDDVETVLRRSKDQYEFLYTKTSEKRNSCTLEEGLECFSKLDPAISLFENKLSQIEGALAADKAGRGYDICQDYDPETGHHPVLLKIAKLNRAFLAANDQILASGTFWIDLKARELRDQYQVKKDALRGLDRYKRSWKKYLSKYKKYALKVFNKSQRANYNLCEKNYGDVRRCLDAQDLDDSTIEEYRKKLDSLSIETLAQLDEVKPNYDIVRFDPNLESLWATQFVGWFQRRSTQSSSFFKSSLVNSFTQKIRCVCGDIERVDDPAYCEGI